MTEVVEDVPEETPEPVDNESPNVKAAKEVLSGYWGRGHTRDQRLQDAGYDVAEVNKEMFKLLGR